MLFAQGIGHFWDARGACFNVLAAGLKVEEANWAERALIRPVKIMRLRQITANEQK